MDSNFRVDFNKSEITIMPLCAQNMSVLQLFLVDHALFFGINSKPNKNKFEMSELCLVRYLFSMSMYCI